MAPQIESKWFKNLGPVFPVVKFNKFLDPKGLGARENLISPRKFHEESPAASGFDVGSRGRRFARREFFQQISELARIFAW
jgi:hypothetical protein